MTVGVDGMSHDDFVARVAGSGCSFSIIALLVLDKELVDLGVLGGMIVINQSNM